MLKYGSASNLYIDGKGTDAYSSAEDYEQAVRMVLDRLANTRSGSALLKEIGRSGTHLVRIVPLTKTVFNAYAEASSERGGTAKGSVWRRATDGARYVDNSGNDFAGFGTGTSVKLSFNPTTFYYSCSQGQGGNPGAKPDEILFHEMVHASREIRGIMDLLPLGFGYDTEEEFFAIVLASIYASETGRNQDIRLNHHGFGYGHGIDTDELIFPRKDPHLLTAKLFAKLFEKQPAFMAELATVGSTYNPVRRYQRLFK
ncbi:MAG TPA: M91 family zinc metallopeptidase [Bryobacteraceae bacterium]|nr:M91 family zinc metallopeptidase [Bryobacteraceae bacterium]